MKISQMIKKLRRVGVYNKFYYDGRFYYCKKCMNDVTIDGEFYNLLC